MSRRVAFEGRKAQISYCSRFYKMSSYNSTPGGEIPKLPSDSRPQIFRATAYCAFMALAAYATVRTVAYATTKPFWIDEVLTQMVSRLGDLRSIVNSLNQGVDGQPPLFYLMERGVASLLHDSDLGYRLLSIIGFACTLVLLYVFVKARNGTTSALFSTSIILITQLFTYYAAEARPYSLLTACIALALVCYQRACSSLWVAGLSLSLLLACAIHFYGIVELLPFVLAELTVVHITNKIRTAVWLALILAPLPLVFSLPLLLRMKQNWGAHFWNQSYIGPGYSSFFSGMGTYGGTVVAGVAVIVMLASFFLKTGRAEPGAQTAPSSAERVLILSLILLPMVGYAAGRVAHMAFVNRYFIPSILGIAAAAGYLFARAKPWVMLLSATLLVFLLGRQETQFWTSRHQASPTQQFLQLVGAAQREDLPIAVSDLNGYVEFWHCVSSPAIRGRMVALADPDSAVLYIGSDTVDKIGLTLRSYLPLQIMRFSSFAAEHPVFLLYSDGSAWDWWPARLRHEGYYLRLLGVHGSNSMYLVQLEPIS